MEVPKLQGPQRPLPRAALQKTKIPRHLDSTDGDNQWPSGYRAEVQDQISIHTFLRTLRLTGGDTEAQGMEGTCVSTHP